MPSDRLKLTPEVIATLRASTVQSTPGGAVLVLPAQLERKHYLAVNAALELLGGAWNRKAKGHVFDDDPRVAIEEAVLIGSIHDLDTAYQFFPTPPAVVHALMEAAGPLDGKRILEPSAGRGDLLHQLPAHVDVTACEIDMRHHAALRQELKRLARGVLVERPSDFVFWTPATAGTFDVVLMNPPFSKGRDVRHILHAWSLLNPGGRLVSVASPSIEFSQRVAQVSTLRALISARGRIEKLPDGAFRASGTDVRTVMVVLNKGA